MSDIAFRSASDLAAAIVNREIGSEELLDHYLDRINRFDPEINSVVATNVERARERAREADNARAKGKLWGPLHGVPVTIKDSIEVAGMPTTAGAPELRNHVPVTNAPTVERLVAAGAIVFGKTNLPLYAGDFQSYNEVYGTTNNPWDTERGPGGSSGGAAAALAAGLTGLEVGSDIGGSIRNPAHFCGVYGHKPTHGLVPSRGHIPGPPGTIAEPDIAVLGPLARSADDLELSLSLLAGGDPIYGDGAPLSLPEPRGRALKDFRVALWLDDPVGPVSHAVSDRLQSLADTLSNAGVEVDDKIRPGIDTERAFGVYCQLLFGVMGAGLPEEVQAQLRAHAETAEPHDMSMLTRVAVGATQTYRDWLVANEERQQMRARWAEFFKDVDVLLCPISPTPAFPHDHSPDQLARTLRLDNGTIPYMEQVFWAGLTGMVFLPATVAPAGLTPDGLPVGVQIVAPYREDWTSIAFAEAMAEAFGGFVPPPAYA